MMKLTKRQALALSTYYNEVRKLKSIKCRTHLKWRAILHTPAIEWAELTRKYPNLLEST